MRQGADLTQAELEVLCEAIDLNKDGNIDIDEFMNLMNADFLREAGNSEVAKSAYFNIKKARRLQPKDFLKFFTGMPSNFMPSFISE